MILKPVLGSLLLLGLAVDLCTAAPRVQAPLIVRDLDGVPIVDVQLGEAFSTSKICTLGTDVPFVGPAAAIGGYMSPPQDSYFLLIQPEACAGSPSSAVLTSAGFALFFRSVRCFANATLTVVSSMGPPDCLLPDVTRQLLTPVRFQLAPLFAGVVTRFTFNLENGLALTGPAFLAITIDSFVPECEESVEPMLVTVDEGCSTCSVWNRKGPGEPTNDLCSTVLEPLDVGSLAIHVTVEHSGTTASLPESWGSLKIRYASP